MAIEWMCASGWMHHCHLRQRINQMLASRDVCIRHLWVRNYRNKKKNKKKTKKAKTVIIIIARSSSHEYGFISLFIITSICILRVFFSSLLLFLFFFFASSLRNINNWITVLNYDSPGIFFCFVCETLINYEFMGKIYFIVQLIEINLL